MAKTVYVLLYKDMVIGAFDSIIAAKAAAWDYSGKGFERKDFLVSYFEMNRILKLEEE